MKYDYESMYIDGVSVAEAIAALQAWETENPEATDSTLTICGSEDYPYVEISYYRQYTSEELKQIKVSEQKALEWQELQERQAYEKLKLKFEGNQNGN